MAGIKMGEREEQRDADTSASADLDPIAQKAYDYYSFGSYGGITYGKTASVLLTLEGIIGEDTMQKAMHIYFMKYRFTHPTKEDFLKTIEEVSGKNLRWYFNQAIYGSPVIDYEVRKIETFPANWYEEKKDRQDKKKTQDDTVYNSFVVASPQGRLRHARGTRSQFSATERKFASTGTGRAAGRDSLTRKKRKSCRQKSIPTTRSCWIGTTSTTAATAEPNDKPGRKVTNYWLFITQWVGQALAWWAV